LNNNCQDYTNRAEEECAYLKSQLSGWSHGVRTLMLECLSRGPMLSKVLTTINTDLPVTVNEYDLTRKGDLSGTRYYPVSIKYMATDFTVPLDVDPKSFLTLLKWECQPSMINLDDLILIQTNWLEYGYLPYGEDTTWILLSIQSYLDNVLQRACDDKLGIRAILTLSILWQMQTVLDQTYDLQKTTSLSSALTKIALSGFAGFVMASRICKMYSF